MIDPTNLLSLQVVCWTNLVQTLETEKRIFNQEVKEFDDSEKGKSSCSHHQVRTVIDSNKRFSFPFSTQSSLVSYTSLSLVCMSGTCLTPYASPFTKNGAIAIGYFHLVSPPTLCVSHC
jgi:hypothetical protein